MSIGVRSIEGELSPSLIVTLRNVLTLALLLPFALRDPGTFIRTKRLGGHAWRGAIGAIGMITWTYCITVMPLGLATALSFTAPLFSTLFAILFLGEKGGMARWLAMGCGLIGTLIILRPDPSDFQWIELLVIAATASWAITGMFVKSLSRTEPAWRMVFYMNLVMALVALPFGFSEWQMPSVNAWAILLFIACCSIIMHFAMARAYALAPVVTLMPLDFTRLISTALFAYIAFGETSDAISWLGAAIIVASAVIMVRRDAKSPPAGPSPE